MTPARSWTDRIGPCVRLRYWTALVVTLLLSGILGCRRSDPDRESTKLQVSGKSEALLGHALVQYADIAHAAYGDSVRTAQRFRDTLQQFLRDPSAEGLDRARQAWIAARKPYLQTEVYRFYGGPIDQFELMLNTWPIDENYVEAADSSAPAGIVEDRARYPELSANLLRSLNAKQGETSISTGYHVIEFLLWGRDTAPDGPGSRPYTDYVVADAGSVAARRSRYVEVASELLQQQLEAVRDAWAPGRADNYRHTFLALPPLEALALVIRGMGSLSGPELAGERLTVAYETKDQENEHSCFSDTTHVDIAFDAQGIQNICTGRYVSSDGQILQGPGVCTFVAAQLPELAARLTREVQASQRAAEAIPAPFDQAILGADAAPGRQAIARAITAFETQTETLAELARAFELRVSLASPGRP